MKKLLMILIICFFGVSGVKASQQYDDLVKLVKSGAGEQVIIAYINACDSSYNLTSDEIASLKGNGATTNEIIAAIQHKGSAAATPTTQVAPSESPAVVQPGPYVVYRTAPWRARREISSAWYEQRLARMNQALQIDILGLADGTMKLNYEYLFNHQHGIVVEGSYFYNGTDSRGETGELAYRWHWARSMNSGFVGVFFKGSRLYGNENEFVNEPDFPYTQTSFTVGPDIGKRWVTPWGLNVVGRVGYGYTISRFKDPAPDQNTMDWVESLASLDYEVSIGYAF